MPSAPAGGRYGMQGGRLEAVAPGETLTAGETIRARCGCGTWTIVPGDLGTACHFCSWPLRPAATTDQACRHCRRLISATQHAAGWCPYCGEPVDREVRAS